jgi:hypothetical protein
VPTFGLRRGPPDEHLADLVDHEFTARWRSPRRDRARRGQLPYLPEFCNGSPGLKAPPEQKAEAIDPRAACTIPINAAEVNRPTWSYLADPTSSVRTAKSHGADPRRHLSGRGDARAAIDLLSQGRDRSHCTPDRSTDLRPQRTIDYLQLGDADGSASTKPNGVAPSAHDERHLRGARLSPLPRSLGGPRGRSSPIWGGSSPHKRSLDTRSLPRGTHPEIGKGACPGALAAEKQIARAAPRTGGVFPAVKELEGRDLKVLGALWPYVMTADQRLSSS